MRSSIAFAVTWHDPGTCAAARPRQRAVARVAEPRLAYAPHAACCAAQRECRRADTPPSIATSAYREKVDCSIRVLTFSGGLGPPVWSRGRRHCIDRRPCSEDGTGIALAGEWRTKAHWSTSPLHQLCADPVARAQARTRCAESRSRPRRLDERCQPPRQHSISVRYAANPPPDTRSTGG